MKFKNKPKWDEYLAANSDSPYGAEIMRYAESWANLMESAINAGEPLMYCAKRLSRVADTESITGFMYGCAVQILSECWISGVGLREWHNKETQIQNEGDKASKDRKVLNPALLILKE
jgi:hypothetical protein